MTKSNQKSLGDADLSKNISTRMFVKTRNRSRAYSDKLTNKEISMRRDIFVSLKSADAQTLKKNNVMPRARDE